MRFLDELATISTFILVVVAITVWGIVIGLVHIKPVYEEHEITVGSLSAGYEDTSSLKGFEITFGSED